MPEKVPSKKEIGDYCGIITLRQVVTGEAHSRRQLWCRLIDIWQSKRDASILQNLKPGANRGPAVWVGDE